MQENKKLILIIEDDLTHTNAYKKTLEKNNYSVCNTDNAEEGIELAEKLKPNIILLDVMLPGSKNGFEMLKQVKEDENLKNIPVFMITNLGDEHKAEALKLGAYKYFVKTNISLDELMEEIKSVI